MTSISEPSVLVGQKRSFERAAQPSSESERSAGPRSTTTSEHSWKSVSTIDQPPETKRRKRNETFHEYTEWERHRETIEALYAEHDIQEVMRRMESEHDFKGSLSQYKSKLNQWKISKNTKFTPKQLLYIAQEVIRRSSHEKGPAFRFHGSRLKSKNVGRALSRNLEPVNEQERQAVRLKGGKSLEGRKEFDILSLTSRFSAGCSLSGYTASSNGVKVSWLSMLGLGSRRGAQRSTTTAELIVEETNLSHPVPPPDLGKCLVKVFYTCDAGCCDFGKWSDETPMAPPEIFDPWHMTLLNGQSILDRALLQLRSNEDNFFVNFRHRGFPIPEDLIALLCVLDFTSAFCHGKRFSAFRLDQPSRILGNDGRQYRIEKQTVSPDIYKIECGHCGWLHIFKAPGEKTFRSHREERGVWPDTFLVMIRECMVGHLDFMPATEPFEDRESLVTYFQQWHDEDVEEWMKNCSTLCEYRKNETNSEALENLAPDPAEEDIIPRPDSDEWMSVVDHFEERQGRDVQAMLENSGTTRSSGENTSNAEGPEELSLEPSEDQISLSDLIMSTLWEMDETESSEKDGSEGNVDPQTIAEWDV